MMKLDNRCCEMQSELISHCFIPNPIFTFEMSKENVTFVDFNPLSANHTKWSNTLKQFVAKSRRIV